jgi:hypothetical protein
VRGAWDGTTPLVVVAGLAMFVAGLDGVETLAQEIDHPSRREASPFEAGHIHLRHVPVAAVVMLVPAAVAAVVAGIHLGGLDPVPVGVAAAVAAPLALGGIGGALVSVLGGPITAHEAWTLAPPEAQGMRLAFRTAWPPAIAIIGALPVLAARVAVDDGRPGPQAALGAAAGVATLFVLVCGWVRIRDRVAAWWRTQAEMAFPSTTREADRG